MVKVPTQLRAWWRHVGLITASQLAIVDAFMMAVGSLRSHFRDDMEEPISRRVGYYPCDGLWPRAMKNGLSGNPCGYLLTWTSTVNWPSSISKVSLRLGRGRWYASSMLAGSVVRLICTRLSQMFPSCGHGWLARLDAGGRLIRYGSLLSLRSPSRSHSDTHGKSLGKLCVIAARFLCDFHVSAMPSYLWRAMWAVFAFTVPTSHSCLPDHARSIHRW